MRETRGIFHALGLAAVGLVGLAGTASARVETADVGLNQSFLQTSSSAPSLLGAFFSARVFFDNVGEYTSGTLTVPTSPSTTYGLASQGYDPDVEIGYETTGSLSELQTQFPAGDYNFVVNANGGNPEVDLTIPYATPSAYPNTPEVTNYNALNGMNAGNSFTVDLNPITTSPNSTDNAIFVDLYSTGGGAPLLAESLMLDQTSFVIPAGLLAAGQSYFFDLDYSGRIGSTTGGDTPITLTQFYDMDTEVDFSTAAGVVPEPSTWAMLIIGFGGMGLMMRRRALAVAKAA